MADDPFVLDPLSFLKRDAKAVEKAVPEQRKQLQEWKDKLTEAQEQLAAAGQKKGFFARLKISDAKHGVKFVEGKLKDAEENLARLEKLNQEYLAGTFPLDKDWGFEEIDKAVTKLIKQLKTEGDTLSEFMSSSPWSETFSSTEPKIGFFSYVGVKDKMTRDSRKIWFLVLEIERLQEKRSELFSSFARSELSNWAKTDLSIEGRKRRRDLTELPYQNLLSRPTFLNKLRVHDVITEERRFLEDCIERLEIYMRGASDVRPKSEDEIKMDAAKSRTRRDIQFETDLRLGKELYTLIEIQQWRKDQIQRVRDDLSLTPDEKEERLEQIDRVAHREKGNIKSSFSIYEDD